jgi:hypothetical protein
MRKLYEMNEEQFIRLIEACKPVTYIVVGGVYPKSPQENAMDAWKDLGKEMGFDWETVVPCPTRGNRFFYAEAIDE